MLGDALYNCLSSKTCQGSFAECISHWKSPSLQAAEREESYMTPETSRKIQPDRFVLFLALHYPFELYLEPSVKNASIIRQSRDYKYNSLYRLYNLS
jgi:hypothetical protein